MFILKWLSGTHETHYELCKKDDDFAAEQSSRIKAWIANHPIKPDLYQLDTSQIQKYISELVNDLNGVITAKLDDLEMINVIGTYLKSIAEQSEKVRVLVKEKCKNLKCSESGRDLIWVKIVLISPTRL